MGEGKFMISEAAKKLQVEAHVLRYWEEELGLHIGRTEMGHRYYTEDDIQLFLCIQKLKNEGILLRELKSLIPQLTELRRKKTEEKNTLKIKEGTSPDEAENKAASEEFPQKRAACAASSRDAGSHRQSHASVALARCMPKEDSAKSLESVLAKLTEITVDTGAGKDDKEPAFDRPAASGPETRSPAQAARDRLPTDVAPAVPTAAKSTQTAPTVPTAAKSAQTAPAVSTAAKSAQTAPTVPTAAKSAQTAPAVPTAAKSIQTAEVIEVTHLEQVRALFGDVITEAITSNNQTLEKNISRRVTSSVCREIDLLFQAQEHQEEEHYRKLDQLIRQQQSYRRESAENAPMGTFKKLFT